MTLPSTILQVDERGILVWMPWWIEERLDFFHCKYRARLTFPAIEFKATTRGKITLTHRLSVYFRPLENQLFISSKRKKDISVNIYFPQDDVQVFRTEGVVIEIFQDGHIEFANETDPSGFFEPDIVYKFDTRTIFFEAFLH